VKITPLDFTITNNFLGSLSENELTVLHDLSAGYNMKEISARTSISQSRIPVIRQSLQNKAVAYL
jgi:DNA-binding NarL/FixJ family response regulator